LQYNIFKDNFDCLESNEPIYPDANFVQFMLPCFVVSFLETSKVKWRKVYKNNKLIYYLANFVHNLIQLQERSFLHFQKTRKAETFHNYADQQLLIMHTKRLGDSSIQNIVVNQMMRMRSCLDEGLPYMDSEWNKIFLSSLKQTKLKECDEGNEDMSRLCRTHNTIFKKVIFSAFDALSPHANEQKLQPAMLNLLTLEIIEIVATISQSKKLDSFYSDYFQNIGDLTG